MIIDQRIWGLHMVTPFLDRPRRFFTATREFQHQPMEGYQVYPNVSTLTAAVQRKGIQEAVRRAIVRLARAECHLCLGRP